ncbi:glutathione S-transferase family protein [Parvularcula bermudensis]|nr:glutathione S-transferase [Parvularcula bermudensis]
MTMKFYDFPGAPSPRRARIALLEKGVSFDTVIVDLVAGEHLGDAYRAINPGCTVPALILDDGTVLGENHGIFAYLEAAYPEPSLTGETPAEKGLVAQWNARCEYEGLLAVAEILRNAAPQMKGRALTGPHGFDQIPALIERGAKRLAAFWSVLDATLAEREFLAIDRFSLADITALVAVDFAKVVRQRPPAEMTNIWRWRDALDRRPSVMATNIGRPGSA